MVRRAVLNDWKPPVRGMFYFSRKFLRRHEVRDGVSRRGSPIHLAIIPFGEAAIPRLPRA
ncbi:hypothetical protein GCM10008965_34820 [Methylorubrum aminovorans]